MTFKPNEDLVFSFDLYENGGINNIEHIALYLNNHGPDLKTKDYDTSIVYDKYSSEQLTLSDPNELIESYDLEIVEIDGFNFKVNFNLKFLQSLDTTNMYVTVWDSDRNPTYKTHENILQVSDSENLSNIVVYDKDMIDENTQIFYDDVELAPTEPIVNPYDAFEDIPNPLTPSLTDSFEEPFINSFEDSFKVDEMSDPVDSKKDVESITNLTPKKSDTLSTIIVIFILEIILGILAGVIFMKQRKIDPDATKTPLRFSNWGK